MSISEIADEMFVDESNIRRAIYKLSEQGVVKSIGTVGHIGAGRPKTRYINLTTTLPSMSGPLWPKPSECGESDR